MVGRLHSAGIVHGDLTTSNIIVRGENCVLIDFGLSLVSSDIRSPGGWTSMSSSRPSRARTGDHETLQRAFIEGYGAEFPGLPESSLPRTGDRTPGALPVKFAVVTSNPHKAKEVAAFFDGVLEVEHVNLESPEPRASQRRGDREGEGPV